MGKGSADKALFSAFQNSPEVKNPSLGKETLVVLRCKRSAFSSETNLNLHLDWALLKKVGMLLVSPQGAKHLQLFTQQIISRLSEVGKLEVDRASASFLVGTV